MYMLLFTLLDDTSEVQDSTMRNAWDQVSVTTCTVHQNYSLPPVN